MDYNVRWGDSGELWTHRSFVKNPTSVGTPDSLKLGDIVAFIYDAKPRYAFVVTPNYFKKMHVLDLEIIGRDLLLSNVLSALDVAKESKMFYDLVCASDEIARKDAYRSFNIPKIQSLMKFHYIVPSSEDRSVEMLYDGADQTPEDLQRVKDAEAKRLRKMAKRLKDQENQK